MADYYTDSCDYATEVAPALAGASAGDRVIMPAGSATWNTGFQIPADITLMGAGPTTEITMGSSAPAGTLGLMRLTNGSRVREFKLINANLSSSPASTGKTAFIVYGGSREWVIENMVQLASDGAGAYYAIIATGAYGLIAGCDITGGTGTSELVLARGPSDSWETPSTMGTAEALYIENCIFRGRGYVCDSNSNGRMVVRKCLIKNHGIKIDAHGVASTTPARSSRHIEFYDNHWDNPVNSGGAVRNVEIRGGTCIGFRNTTPSSVTGGSTLNFSITEYGVFQSLSVFGHKYQTPNDYPIRDQIGRGQYAIPGDPTSATSEPAYLFLNRRLGVQWPITHSASNLTNAINQYRIETGDPDATFTWADIIQHNRDYFNEVSSFNGSSGVGVGTKAGMLAITPTLPGVGYWVTDEGNWDADADADESGQLYRWSGASWELFYVPYTYPHPLLGAVAAPTISAQPTSRTVEEGQSTTFTISASGNPSLTFQWRKGGVAISGKTASTLAFVNVQISDAGSYDCVITNSQGSVTSSAATLTVDAFGVSIPPTITLQPVGVTTYAEEDVTFTIAATGDPTPTYQWRKNGVAISGETGTTLFLAIVSESDEATYSCTVSNQGGSVLSDIVSLTVDPIPPPAPSGLGNPTAHSSRANLVGISLV
jgi:hypothetical protein